MENLTSQNLDFKGMNPVKQVKVCYLNIPPASDCHSNHGCINKLGFENTMSPLEKKKQDKKS